MTRLLLIATFLLSTQATSLGQQITIDIREQSEPISPYIYGQFIEHLGRCIYGGIWAEMLEDRKFFYPVTGEAPAWELYKPGDDSWRGEGHPYELLMRSPWMVIGSHTDVRMNTTDAFVGEHSPEIVLSDEEWRGGLYQERLELQKGRHYVGRVVLSGVGMSEPAVVSLVWGKGAGDRQTIPLGVPGSVWETKTFAFSSHSQTDNGKLEIYSSGSGTMRIGVVSLMPADNIYGWRKEVVSLLKELDAPVYRWPGGNFVSGYDWRDGIGDRDRRPPRKNPAWTGVEHNDVGIHEYLELMRLIHAEAFIAVNTGLGGAEEAAAQLEYVNGNADTDMGRLRAENGRSAPWDVSWWAIGNEMYGDWQLGHMPLEEYVDKHNQVVEAMREVDPDIRPIAVGEAGEWSETMMTSCSDHMDLISEHAYWQDRDGLVDHVEQITQRIRHVADIHRSYRDEIRGLEEKDIRIAMDEWNYWYGPNEYGELGVRYFLQDALGIAAGLHEFFRNSDMYFMANYAQTVNVIGAIKTTGVDAEFEPTGLVLKMYREHFGSTPVAVSTEVGKVDVSAALSEDGLRLTLAVINVNEETVELELNLLGAETSGAVSRWTLTGVDRWSYNEPGQERGVDIRTETLESGVKRLEVEPISVTLFEYALR